MNSVFNNIKHFPMEFNSSSSLQNDMDYRGSFLWGKRFGSIGGGSFSKVSNPAELSNAGRGGDHSGGESRFRISTCNKNDNLMEERYWEWERLRFQPVENQSFNASKYTTLRHASVTQMPLNDDKVSEDDRAFFNPPSPSQSQYELARAMNNLRNLRQLYRTRSDSSASRDTSFTSASTPIHFQASKSKRFPASRSINSTTNGCMNNNDLKGKDPNESTLTELIQTAIESDNNVLTYDSRWTFGSKTDLKNVEHSNESTSIESENTSPTTNATVDDYPHPFAAIYQRAIEVKSNTGLEVSSNSSFPVRDIPKAFSIVNSVKGHSKSGKNITFHNKQRSKGSMISEQSTCIVSIENRHAGITSIKKEMPKNWMMAINSSDFSVKLKERFATDNMDKIISRDDGKPSLTYPCKPKVVGKNHVLKSKEPPVIKGVSELLLNPYENCECVFCKGNNQTEDVYMSHPIRINEIVVCPFLRNYVCAICKATGDQAHTIKYCPFNRRGFFAMRENFPPPKRYANLFTSGQLENHPSIDFKKVKIIQNIWKSKPHMFASHCDNSSGYQSDTQLYSLSPSNTHTGLTGPCCCSNKLPNNNSYFQNLEKRLTPKKQKMGYRAGTGNKMLMNY